MNAFTLRTKIASPWKLDVIGMSLGECIDYIKECFTPMDWITIVIWDVGERSRIAEVSRHDLWITREWCDRLDEDSALAEMERYHERY